MDPNLFVGSGTNKVSTDWNALQPQMQKGEIRKMPFKARMMHGQVHDDHHHAHHNQNLKTHVDSR